MLFAAVATGYEVRTLGVHEVDDLRVHKDVDLLYAGNGVDAKPFQCVLQPLVVCAGGLMYSLLLSALSTTCHCLYRYASASYNAGRCPEQKQSNCIHP